MEVSRMTQFRTRFEWKRGDLALLMLAASCFSLHAWAEDSPQPHVLSSREANLVLGAGMQTCHSNPCNTCEPDAACDYPIQSCGWKYVSGGGNPGWSCVAGYESCVLSEQNGESVTSDQCLCNNGLMCMAMGYLGSCSGKKFCCQTSPCP